MKLSLALVGICAAMLAACGPRIDNERLRVDVVENQPRAMAVGALPLPPASAYLRMATARGLVGFDLEGRVVPALAARWITTEDGLSYIFRLEKTRWNDGRDISSDEVAVALSRRLIELRNSRIASELAVIDRIVPMTGKVVEIRLKAPMPNLLELLAQPELGLLRKNVGSGPMVARKQAGAMQLSHRADDPERGVALDDARLTLASHDGPTALARFVVGESDLVLEGRFEHLPYLAATEGREGAVYDSPPGLFGLLFVAAGPFLSEASNREAITKAVDRPRMISDFNVNLWKEMLTISPETLPNRADVARPDWASRRMDQRKTEARDAIRNWEAANGPVRALRIAMPRGPGSRMLFARLKSDFAAIGLSVERVTIGQQEDMRLIDQTADMTSPAWYLEQLSCQVTTICSAEADAMVAEAQRATDRDERMRLLGEAELKLQNLRNFVPLANPVRWSLPRNGLLGFTGNARGWHPLQYLGRDTK
ncbi:MAG: ABC transporter substrate-binding protein [Sphingorhabdus sp.]